jgi:hypothetical protein
MGKTILPSHSTRVGLRISDKNVRSLARFRATFFKIFFINIFINKFDLNDGGLIKGDEYLV